MRLLTRHNLYKRAPIYLHVNETEERRPFPAVVLQLVEMRRLELLTPYMRSKDGV